MRELETMRRVNCRWFRAKESALVYNSPICPPPRGYPPPQATCPLSLSFRGLHVQSLKSVTTINMRTCNSEQKNEKREFTYLQYCAFHVVELSHMARQMRQTFSMIYPELIGENGNTHSVVGYVGVEGNVFVFFVGEWKV